MTTYTLQVIDNPLDPTFNQLLSINAAGQIAGYYGSGLAGHPNKGYTTNVGGKVFTPENYPFSVQTQVTGINDEAWTVGFEIDAAGNSLGFLDIGGNFTLCEDPAAPVIGGLVNEQFLSINDRGIAVGFYTKDAAGDAAAFIYYSGSNTYSAVTIGNTTSVTAAGIDQSGDICGFFTNTAGQERGFVHTAGGKYTILAGLAGWTNIQALGLNDAGLVVGSYQTTAGNTDGFTYNLKTNTYQSFSYGNGTQTVLNGINAQGDIVGFYVDNAGNTDGILLRPPAPAFNWTFTTLDDPADPTFNQLLAINDYGEIAGYFGSGATGHPNQGYLLTNDTTFTKLNFPTSVQTQETGINNAGATVGFEIDQAGNTLGFYQKYGAFQLILDPAAPVVNGVVSEQLLGLNDRGAMAGFYTSDAAGDTVGFVYNQPKGSFTNVHIAGAVSTTASDVNDLGWISGFYSTTSGGPTLGFVEEGATIVKIAGAAGDSNIQVLGINNNYLAVGSFVDSAGNTEGFVDQLLTNTFTAVNAPTAVGQTVLNGVNDRDQITGFYMDSAGNTHGLLVTPSAV